ncbi:MAG TPA: hypothetical protein VLE91_03490 [Candidatus Saccharimonadales bacterium]|nr:hypothetical protein [Candidatus Saccharimonadales bacterium]
MTTDGDVRTPQEVARRAEVASQLSGRVVMMTGASEGTGEYVAAEIPGIEVIAGMRFVKDRKTGVIDPGKTTAKFEKVANQIGVERTLPFIADITNDEEVGVAYSKLKEQGKYPTDVILSAAGGLEGALIVKMISVLRGLQRGKRNAEQGITETISGTPATTYTGEQVDEKLAQFEIEISEEIEAQMPAAEAINVTANINLLEKIKESKQKGEITGDMRVIFYSSTPSTFFGEDLDEDGNDRTPFFYTGVAQTKNKFEKWMEEHWQEYAEVGIYFGILSMHLILGTRVHEFFEQQLKPFVSEETWKAVEPGFIDQSLAYEATEQMLVEDISKWKNGVRRLYAVGDKILEEMTVGDENYATIDMPFEKFAQAA